MTGGSTEVYYLGCVVWVSFPVEYWEILNHYGWHIHTLQIIVNTVLNWWMSDLNIRPRPIPTKVSRIFDRVLDRTLSDEKIQKWTVWSEERWRKIHRHFSCPSVHWFDISYCLLFHVANGLHLSQTQESELPKDLPKGFTGIFKKLLESCWSWKKKLNLCSKNNLSQQM